ncbi:exportin-6-A isoform X1 [Thrips palmi]|uniref:Exportin-6-A isoform X1 n=1 Tax=Thrips palmi TaxID=161013 RepID=A0A6P9A2A9_THRPL|nr:exportin-6-A isoform X1 [Thrips palmi]
MAGDAASLSALEGLMKEFFSNETSNGRKHEIEQVLHAFSSQHGSWQHCLYFLAHSADPYVCMYCLTTIETVINKQWSALAWEERAQLRTALYQLLLQRHTSVATFVRNKLVKLVVDVARLDWPHFYPDFLTNIIQLLQNADTVTLGLVFVQTSSEELISSREDLSVSRREELRRLLLQYVPQLFAILTGVLEEAQQSEGSANRRGSSTGSVGAPAVTATPPPSPTHGQPHSASPPGSLLSCMLSSGGRGSSTGVVRLALEALSHLLSWAPLGEHVSTALTSAIFYWIHAHHSVHASNTDTSLSALAMATINEIFYKKCVPNEWEDSLLGLCEQALALSHELINHIENLSEDLIEKLLDFLRLVVSQHLHRLEKSPKWLVSQLLSLLLRFTFQQPHLDGYYQCLEIWEQLLEYLQQRQNSQLNARYQEALVLLVGQVLKKMQFRQNRNELLNLDDETLDDDGETEWQRFLRESIESIAKVAELAPLHIYALVLEPWKEVCSEYTHLCSEKVVTNADLQHSVRDLASLTQAIGRFCPHFTGESFMAGIQQAQQLVQGLVAMAALATKLRPHHWSLSPSTISRNLLLVHAQVLAALKAWSHWVAQMQASSVDHALVDRLINDMVRATVALLQDHNEPSTLKHAAAHLLLTLAGTVKSSQLWNMEQVRSLYSDPLSHLQSSTQSVVRQALCSALVVVGNEDCWEERHKLMSMLLEAMTSDLRRLATSGAHNAQEAAPVISRTFRQLGELVENSQAENTWGRKLLCSSLQTCLEQSLILFPSYVSDAEVSEQVLHFFLASFGTLQVQLGATFTQQAVHTFLECFTREQLSVCLLQEKCGGVEKFLHILQLIVTQPGVAFKHFIPSSITLCMDHIYPVIVDHPAPSIKPALFQLLFSILLHKWQYFYSGQLQNASVRSEHKSELLSILNAFGQSLLQSDINVFRQNLHNLEVLNNRWKLYHKAEFCEGLLPRFLSVLLETLVNKSHALLSEDIAVAVFNMASVDFSFFFSSFLPEFLQTSEGLDDSQRVLLLRNFNNSTDLPSFTQNVSRLTNDMRCYKLCNSFLPAGSIQL